MKFTWKWNMWPAGGQTNSFRRQTIWIVLTHLSFWYPQEPGRVEKPRSFARWESSTGEVSPRTRGEDSPNASIRTSSQPSRPWQRLWACWESPTPTHRTRYIHTHAHSWCVFKETGPAQHVIVCKHLLVFSFWTHHHANRQQRNSSCSVWDILLQIYAKWLQDVNTFQVTQLEGGYADAIRRLWADNGIQACYQRRCEYQLLDSTE